MLRIVLPPPIIPIKHPTSFLLPPGGSIILCCIKQLYPVSYIGTLLVLQAFPFDVLFVYTAMGNSA